LLEKFTEKNFHGASLERIQVANEIVDKYQAMGLRLTLRQLFYQFVSHYDYPNTQKAYKVLGSVINDARLAGLLDWDAIEDRGRQPKSVGEWPSIDVLADDAVRQFRLPRWDGQEHYVELWVEKDALAGVLKPISYEQHVTLMVNKGYSSQSAMYAAAQRFLYKEADYHCVLLYLGDHDPSGEDMVRDIRSRLRMFGASVEVLKVALTMDQIRQYKPPPNPTKMTDARASGYVAKYGRQSWEVDALDPDVLVQLIRDELDQLVDRQKMDRVIAAETKQKKALAAALKQIRSKIVKE
jgi:hypothetical protein